MGTHPVKKIGDKIGDKIGNKTIFLIIIILVSFPIFGINFRENLHFQKEGDPFRKTIKLEQVNVSSLFILGADISSLPQVEDANTIFMVNSVPKNVFNILSSIGFSFARLRLWNNPSNVPEAVDSYCDLNHTITLAKRIKASGWKFLLDIHYSDWWADPGHQNKPKDWENLTFNELKQQVYDYTYNVLNTLNLAGVLPEMIQLGNEISQGFLWPEGSTGNFSNFTELLKSAINAVNDFKVFKNIKTMLHYAPGMNMTGYSWFLSNLQKHNVTYDVLGLSYYPKWHGGLTDLENAVNDIAFTYNKEIIIVETSYAWTIGWDDSRSNVFWNDSLQKGYPATPSGQRRFFEKVIEITQNIPNNLGMGVFLWEPAWVTPAIGGSPMENSGLFDLSNNLLDVYSIPLITNPLITKSELDYSTTQSGSFSSIPDEKISSINSSSINKPSFTNGTITPGFIVTIGITMGITTYLKRKFIR